MQEENTNREGRREENMNRQATSEEGSNKEEAKEHAKAPNADKEANIQEEVLTWLKIRHVAPPYTGVLPTTTATAHYVLIQQPMHKLRNFLRNYRNSKSGRCRVVSSSWNA